LEGFKKGNVVFWKRLMADLFCIVQEVRGDQVLIRYMDAPRNEPPISVNRSELVELAEEQERLPPSDLLDAIRKQREVHYPQKKARKKKKSNNKDLGELHYGYTHFES